MKQRNAPRWSAASCSPTDYSAVPSALGGLTSGFGMGPGVPPLPWPLTILGRSCKGVPSGPHSAILGSSKDRLTEKSQVGKKSSAD